MFKNLTLYDYILTIFTSVVIFLSWYGLYAYNRIKNLTRQLNEANNAREIERHNLEILNHDLNNQIHEVNQRNQFLENRNRNQIERNIGLENEIQSLRNQIVRLNRRNEKPGQAYHFLREDNNRLRREINNLRELIEDNNRPRSEINNLRVLREEGILRSAQQAERINSLEEVNRNLVSENRNLVSENRNLVNERINQETLANEITQLRGLLNNISTEMQNILHPNANHQRPIQINRTNPAERIEQWRSLNDYLTSQNTILVNRVRLFQNQLQQLNNLTANNEQLNANRADLLHQLDNLQNDYVRLDVRPAATLQPLPP